MSEETPTLETRHQVMFFDTDCAGVVHNIAYLRMIEVTRTLLAEKLGWKLAEMGKTGLYPVVVRTEIDYKRPATLGDQLLVKGRLASVDRVRFECAFDVVRESDGNIMVASVQTLALVQMPPGKPVRLPPDWAERYPHLVRK